MDEYGILNRLPSFVSTSPDRMPSARLVEGDLSILWTKLESLEEGIKELGSSGLVYTEIVKHNTEMVLQIKRTLEDFQVAVNDNVNELKVIRQSIHQIISMTNRVHDMIGIHSAIVTVRGLL